MGHFSRYILNIFSLFMGLCHLKKQSLSDLSVVSSLECDLGNNFCNLNLRQKLACRFVKNCFFERDQHRQRIMKFKTGSSYFYTKYPIQCPMGEILDDRRHINTRQCLHSNRFVN